MNFKEDLFKICTSTNVDYNTYLKLVDYANSVDMQARGEENAKFYEVSRKLMTSINNAGWQDRHGKQIDTLNEVMDEICFHYEDFLP